MARDDHKLSFAGSEEAASPAFHVAPLIDIVFLLICFYLLVAQLTSNQKDPSVQLASMANPVAQPEGPAELVVNLRDDGVLTVGGRPVSLPGLRAMLMRESHRAGRADQALTVAIRADRRQQFGRLNDVLAVCRQASVRTLIIRATRSEPK